MRLKRYFSLALTVACSMAGSQALSRSPTSWFDRFDFDRGVLVRVGHEPMAPDPTIRRYTGAVAALGRRDPEGKLYTFKLSPLGPRNFPLSRDDLRGWRMTILSGRHFGEVYWVNGNTESEVTVHRDNGPIDALDVRDVFIIESIDANGASMFAPKTGAGSAASPGV